MTPAMLTAIGLTLAAQQRNTITMSADRFMPKSTLIQAITRMQRER